MENLRNMPFEALVGVVEDWPWFGAAQRVLCERMSLMGGRDLARDMYASAALHVPERIKIISMLRPGALLETNKTLRDYAFREVQVSTPEVVPLANVKPDTNVENTEPSLAEEGVNKNYRGAGDYFSREQYEQVKREAKESAAAENHSGTASNIDSFNFDRDVSLDGFCTEALAEIYAEQGYYERAKDIYSKLILAEPEKNTYFASLIEKLNEKKLKI